MNRLHRTITIIIINKVAHNSVINYYIGNHFRSHLFILKFYRDLDFFYTNSLILLVRKSHTSLTKTTIGEETNPARKTVLAQKNHCVYEKNEYRY